MKSQPRLGILLLIGFLVALVAAIEPASRLSQITKAHTNANNRPRLVVQTGHAGATDAVALSPDGNVVVTGSADGTACLWHAPSGREIRCLRKQEAGVSQTDYSSHGKLILTALQEEGLVRLWDPETG